MGDKTLHVSEGKFFKLLDDLAKSTPGEVRSPVKVYGRHQDGTLIRVIISEYQYNRLLEVDLSERYA